MGDMGWIFSSETFERSSQKGRKRTGWREKKKICRSLCGPATEWKQASAIISFTGAVCLRTISVALGEEESADECSGLLSSGSRGRGAQCRSNFGGSGGGVRGKEG